MRLANSVDFSIIAESELEEMVAAGKRIRRCQDVLRNSGDSILGEVLKNLETVHPWKKYPDGGVYDVRSQSYYYFHIHPPEARPDEYGHFHTFVCPARTSAGGFPETSNGHAGNGPPFAVSHIVAVSMDRTGAPVHLSTTNRWVTGEIWYDAKEACRFLQKFKIGHAQPSWPVNEWLTNLLVLFRPHIRLLLNARDHAVEAWGRKHSDGPALEDRKLEVTSEMAIDVNRHIAAVRSELERRSQKRASAKAAEVKNLRARLDEMTKVLRAVQAKAEAQARQFDLERTEITKNLAAKFDGEMEALRKTHAEALESVARAVDARTEEAVQAKLAKAREQWEAKHKAKLEAVQKAKTDAIDSATRYAVRQARAQWEGEAQQKLEQTAEEWRTTARKELASAKVDWALEQKAALARRDRHWQAELDRRLKQSGQIADAQVAPASAAADERAERNSRPDSTRRQNAWFRRRLALIVALFMAIVGGGVYWVFDRSDWPAHPMLAPIKSFFRIQAEEFRASISLPETIAVNPEQVPSLPQAFVRPIAANLRNAPSTQAKILGVMKRGTRIERLASQNNWVRVRVSDGRIGWVHSSLLSDQPSR